MAIRRSKQIISVNIFLKALLSILIIIVMIVYLKAFFTIGIYFDDTFLKKDVVSSDNHYIGECIYGGIHITVKGLKNKHNSADVIYRLPSDINLHFTVNFKDKSDWDLGIENIEDKDGNIIFEGEYRKESAVLFEENGRPIMDDNIGILVEGENLYNKDYKVPLKNVADLASFSNDTIRGRWDFLVIAILLFVFMLIDIKFPLFFFTLRHFLDVRDPEPSDFYIAMQRITWYICPVIGIIFMIAAIY